MKQNWRSFFGLVILIIINVWLVRSYVDFQPGALNRVQGDALFYQSMSMDPHFLATNPYIFRTMTPNIIRFLHTTWGWGYSFSWLLLAVITTVLMEWCFFLMLQRTLRLSFFVSLVFTVMLSLTYWFTIFNYQDLWLVDPLNNLFWMIGIWSLLARRYWIFFITMAVGLFNKETLLLLLPLAPLFLWFDSKPKARRSFWGGIVLSTLIVGLYVWHKQSVMLHIFLIPGTIASPLAGSQPSIFANFLMVMRYSKNPVDLWRTFDFMWVVWVGILYAMYGSYGWRSKPFVASLYLLPVLTFSCLFITDVPRVLSLLAPLVMLCGALYWNTPNTVKTRGVLLVLLGIWMILNLSWPPTLGAVSDLDLSFKLLIDGLLLAWLATTVQDESITLPETILIDG